MGENWKKNCVRRRIYEIQPEYDISFAVVKRFAWETGKGCEWRGKGGWRTLFGRIFPNVSEILNSPVTNIGL